MTEMGIPSEFKVLVIDDEPIALKSLLHVLLKEGYQVIGAQSGPEGHKALQTQHFDLVVTDLRMDHVDGMQILRYCRQQQPDCAVIMITGFATISSAVDAMKEGAFHYIAKPFRLNEVREVVREALEMVRLHRENHRLQKLIESQEGGIKLVSQDSTMQKLIDTARTIAASNCNVIITGESGTGKELLARLLHQYSSRHAKPFLAVNCGAFSEELLANELFGHEKGAYTGAHESRAGLIEAASGGTLFLDEISEMSAIMQAKLLRVIQEGELLRVGGTRTIRVDVRYLAATNRNLTNEIASGKFRQDLYYRLKVMHFHLPPLSERHGDVPLLAHYFLKKYATLMDKRVDNIAPETIEVLSNYDFPGNVRELANIIERGVALADGPVLDVEDLPDDMRHLELRTYRRKAANLPTLQAQEMDYIRWVLQQTAGNRTRAAEILGIDRVSLWRKIKKYVLETNDT